MKLYLLILYLWIQPDLLESGLHVNFGVKVPPIKVKLPQIKLPHIKITTKIKYTRRRKSPLSFRIPGFSIGADTETEKEADPEPIPEAELDSMPELDQEVFSEPQSGTSEPEEGWNVNNERESIDKWQAERKRKNNLEDIWNDVGKDDYNVQRREKQGQTSTYSGWPYPVSYPWPSWPWPGYPAWPNWYPPANTTQAPEKAQ